MNLSRYSEFASIIIALSVFIAVLYLGLLLPSTVAVDTAIASFTVAVMVAIIFGILWFIWFRMRSRISYRIAIDRGIDIVFCGAKPIAQFEKDDEQYLELKTKCFDTTIVVPRNSFRIMRSRLRGNYLVYLVDSKGTPKAWGEDKVKELDYKVYRQIQQEKMYANVLGLTRWIPLIKWLIIAIIIVVVVFGILLGIEMSQQPQIIIKVPSINQTSVNVTTTTTATIPPPPG